MVRSIAQGSQKTLNIRTFRIYVLFHSTEIETVSARLTHSISLFEQEIQTFIT